VRQPLQAQLQCPRLLFALRATASIKERAAASQAVLDGPFADSTTSAAFRDMPYFRAKTAAS
ncbi:MULTISPECIES: hypothetical protein, partial [unclassified Mesorhizobium]